MKSNINVKIINNQSNNKVIVKVYDTNMIVFFIRNVDFY